AGLRVVIDDSDARPGAKYYKWELKGVPVRIEIGPRDLKNNVVVIARRDGDKTTVPKDTVMHEIDRTLKEMCRQMYDSAKESLYSRITLCTDLDEVKVHIQTGIARIAWCGERSCGLEMEEIVGAGILGKPEDPALCKGEGKCPICGKPTDTVVLMARTY
ncbi:MAG: His/Gly/Thr/Pro-type tRNA ligase C-terminal domain-containing protein, partial [ANME-2 cluster archaeon]|nr:His/Gly/Thr/Pro-type tRNA ligase C-terminal domain-containing protein [ANME-2 cluster archaeon]